MKKVKVATGIGYVLWFIDGDKIAVGSTKTARPCYYTTPQMARFVELLRQCPHVSWGSPHLVNWGKQNGIVIGIDDNPTMDWHEIRNSSWNSEYEQL